MIKMTPREALYYVCLELGPPQTNRNDNINEKEARLRDAIRTLQNFIMYHDDSNHSIPDSANEYQHKTIEDYGLPPLSREDFIE